MSVNNSQHQSNSGSSNLPVPTYSLPLTKNDSGKS